MEFMDLSLQFRDSGTIFGKWGVMYSEPFKK